MLSAEDEMEQTEGVVLGTKITVSRDGEIILEGVCEFRVLTTDTSYMYRQKPGDFLTLVMPGYQLSGPELEPSRFTPGLVTGRDIEVRSNTQEVIQTGVRGFLAGKNGKDYISRGADGSWSLTKGNGKTKGELRDVNIIIKGTNHGVFLDERGKLREELANPRRPTIQIK